MYQLKKTEVTCICDNIYVLTDRAGCCVNLVTGKEKALVFSLGGFFILSRYGLLPTYEAEKDLLNNGGFAPTQMDAQNSIQRKRAGAVRLPSDSMDKKQRE